MTHPIEEIIKKHEFIWGFMYGQPIQKYFDGTEEPDKLVKIKVSQLHFLKNDTGFIYFWGWPGPDGNTYLYSDYRKTWCFHPKEIPNALVYPGDEE